MTNQTNTALSAEVIADNFVSNLVKDTVTAGTIGSRVMEQIRVLVGVPTLAETVARSEALENGKSEDEAITEANTARKKLFNGYKKLDKVIATPDWVNDIVSKYRSSFSEVGADTAGQYASHIKNLLLAEDAGYRELMLQCIEGSKSFQVASRKLTAERKKIEGNSNSNTSGNSGNTGDTGNTRDTESDQIGHSEDVLNSKTFKGWNPETDGFQCTGKGISDLQAIAEILFVKLSREKNVGAWGVHRLALELAKESKKHIRFESKDSAEKVA